jgi:hypothetical protein
MSAYRVYAFDGIEISALNGRASMGTGAADAAFIRVAGGYFDAYGSRRAPQGIRPITVSGWIHQTSGNDRVAKLDELRHRLGERGKLTLAMADDTLRWQWARLVDVDVPADFENVTAFPFNLTWVTADQLWFGVVVSPEEWSWGDLSWTFGDGTAQMGESGTEMTLTATTGTPQDITVNHGGSIPATNVVITVTAGSSSITSIAFINNTNGQFYGIPLTLAPGQQLQIDAGQRAVWFRNAEESISSAINDNGRTVTVHTTTAHGLTTGNTVLLAGGTPWDGIHQDITVTDADTFTFASPLASETAVGAVRQLIEQYGNFKSSISASVWPSLEPGDNLIAISVLGNTSQDAVIGFEFYEHFA